MLRKDSRHLSLCLYVVFLLLVACSSATDQPPTTPTTESFLQTPTITMTATASSTLIATTTPTAAPSNAPTPTVPSTPASTPELSFLDDLDNYETMLWHKADGWTNGPPFWTGWRADHIEFADGLMILRLDDQPCSSDPAACSGQPYASGEYRTNDFYHYGCVEGRLKAAQHNGVVTSLFVYTGPSDGNPHDEIDIEILGKDTTQMQANYFTDGVGAHETMIDLGFDASQDFHTYAFEWSSTTIKWYVDGKLVHTEDGSRGPLPTTPGRIMMNLWPGTGVDGWLGPFTYSGSPIYAYYDWIKFTPSGCPY